MPAQQSRRSSSGELARSGRTPASVGIHLRGTKSGAGRLSGTASSRRVDGGEHDGGGGRNGCRRRARRTAVRARTGIALRGVRTRRVWDRTDERVEARQTVEGVWPETAGDRGGKRQSGRRSSGVSGSNARGHEKACAHARWAPVSTRSTMPGSGEHDDGCGDGHELVGGGQNTGAVAS